MVSILRRGNGADVSPSLAVNKLMVPGWAGPTLALCSGKACLPQRTG